VNSVVHNSKKQQKDSHKPEVSSLDHFQDFVRYLYESSSLLHPFRKVLKPLVHWNRKCASEA